MHQSLTIVVKSSSARRRHIAMKSFGICLVSLLALVAYGESRVASEAPANSPSLLDLVNQAKADIEKLGKELHEKLNVPDQTTVLNTLKTHSTILVDNVKNYVQDMSTQIQSKTPEVQELWSTLKTTLTKATDDIAAHIPVAKNQAAELEAKFIKGVDTMIEQSRVFTQTLNQNSAQIQEDMSKIAKKTVEIALDAAQQLNTQVQKGPLPLIRKN